jgi:hypothetical protein
MKTFFTWIKSLFTVPSYGEGLESYILSKRPTNVAEVEYWANAFERATHKGLTQ